MAIRINYGQALWVYPSEDKAVLPKIEEALKRSEFPHCKLWQNNAHLAAHYPQYLCSIDLADMCGDVVHFWRDGQTWWPCSGDYTLDQEEKAEKILRKALIKFSETKGGVNDS